MNITKEDYKILVDCIEQKERTDGANYYVIKEGTPENIQTFLRDALFEMDISNNLDLTYKVLNSALNALSGVEYSDLKEYNTTETDSTHASVYTAERLSYLTPWTQDEITQKVKEYDCDIQEACAFWYDEQVNQMIDALQAKILKQND